MQPTSLCIDKYNKIWSVSDCGYSGSPYKQEYPGLQRINPITREVEKTCTFDFDDWPQEVCINGGGDTVFFINKQSWDTEVWSKIVIMGNKATSPSFARQITSSSTDFKI